MSDDLKHLDAYWAGYLAAALASALADLERGETHQAVAMLRRDLRKFTASSVCSSEFRDRLEGRGLTVAPTNGTTTT